MTIFRIDVSYTCVQNNQSCSDDFKDFAALCFEEFGDRVKLWVTLNEPWVYSIGGYDTGRKAPGRASKYMNEAAVAGESGLEVYTVSHNLLLAHAEAVEVFRNNPKVRKQNSLCHFVEHFKSICQHIY